MSVYEAEFNVRYSEVDRNNELKPISIMQYFQEIGCLHSDSIGMGMKHNAAWIVIQWKVKILAKANWNDKIVVKTWASGVQGPYCMRDYEIYRENELIAIGTSKWVLMDVETNKICRITNELFQLFNPNDKRVFNEPIEKLKPNDDYNNVITHKVILNDTDTNNHMNNIKYIELAINSIEEDINYIEVMYKHAALYGDTLKLYYNDKGVTIKNGDNISAIVKYKE